MAQDFPKSPNKHWAPPQPLQTPFHQAKQQWDERIGSARVQAYHWRLAALGSCLVSLVCVLGLIYQSSKSQVVPYLVEVEHQGNVRLVGQVHTQDWSLGESSRRLFLEQWITALRSISSDKEVFTTRQAYVQDHLTEAARLQLDQHYQEHHTWERFGEQRRTVQIISMTQLKGSDTAYRVQWQEKTFVGGQKEQSQTLVGEFHLHITPPTKLEQIERNPLGLYVEFFDFDKEKS